jgi:DNA-binding LytR/AlgR family response regulator
MIYIAICDDEEKSVAELEKRVNLLLKENKILATISVYSQSKLLQYDIEEGKYFDLVLSDIEMPNMDGMKLAEYIKQYLPEALVIFITSHTKYAVDAYELSIFRYVPKSSIDLRLNHAVLDAVKLINSKSNRVYHINMPSRVEKIPYQKILYIEREGKNSIITMTDGSKTSVRKSLANVFKELDSEDFAYIDRGNIVNIQYIMKIKDESVELENGIRLLASHAKIEQIKKR